MSTKGFWLHDDFMTWKRFRHSFTIGMGIHRSSIWILTLTILYCLHFYSQRVYICCCYEYIKLSFTLEYENMITEDFSTVIERCVQCSYTRPCQANFLGDSVLFCCQRTVIVYITSFSFRKIIMQKSRSCVSTNCFFLIINFHSV